jgi:predicted dehydrogenase
MGTGHCTTIREIEEIELAAVADFSAARAKEVGEKFGVPHFAGTRDLFRSGKADAVVIATPHYFHPTIAIDAFKAGLHVLSEKPIAVQVADAERMIKAAKKSGKVFSAMFQMRTMAHVKVALEIVRSGQIGEIRRTLLVSPEFRSQAYYNSGTWRATWAGEGGGVLLNQAPHIMDVFVELGGMPSKLQGRCATLLHEIEVEDHAEALLEYPNGAGGYFYTSTCEPGERVLEIVGDAGKLRLVGDKLLLWRFRPSIAEFNRVNTEMWGSPKVEPEEVPVEPCEQGHKVVLRNFARAILHGEELIVPGEVGLKSLELANAIILSSYERQPVKLPIGRRKYKELLARLCSKSKFRDGWGDTKPQTDPQFKK